MRRAAFEDHHADPYAVLGVPAHAPAAEIRRAYRRLALRHHPDRAGPAATATFQRIVAAYGVLSDPARRARHDACAGARTAGSTAGGARARPPGDGAAAVPARPLPRHVGHLSVLVAEGTVVLCQDGTIEIVLAAAERATGGVAAIGARLPISCPTCGGLAARHGFRCERCEDGGVVIALATAFVAVPRGVEDGAALAARVEAPGRAPPLRFRARL